MGQLIGQVAIPSSLSISSKSSNMSPASLSILLIKVKIGIFRITQTLKSFLVCASTPLDASMTITAESAAISVRYVSSEKSWCPGVSSILIQKFWYSNCNTLEVTEIPLSFSLSIQSETACLAVAFPFTLPARLIAPPYSRNFSVNVVFPASGCEIIANVLLLFISSV